MNQNRLKRGDTSPEKPGLVFLCYNRGRERWVTPERLADHRAKSADAVMHWQKSDKFKAYVKKRNATAKHKAYMAAYRSTPEYRARVKELRAPKREAQNAAALARYYKNHAKHLAANKTPKMREKYRANNKRWLATANGKLRASLRRRVWNALHAKNCKRQTRVIELLGCSIEEYKNYLQSQFHRGMSWNNHGVFWEIDHKKPIAKFDLTKPEEQRAAFHFSNCQPLWKDENRRKSAKYHHGSHSV